MAASSADKDYVHRLVASIGTVTGYEPTMMIGGIQPFEANYNNYNIQADLQTQLDFKADIVIVQLGENVATPTTPESQAELKKSCTNLLNIFKNNSRPSFFVTRAGQNTAGPGQCRQAARVAHEILTRHSIKLITI